MRVAILGPLAVADDSGEPISVAGSRLRTLLVRLALDTGRSVRADALIDAVWAEDPPAGAANALQTLVSRLRRSLPPDAINAVPIGDGIGYCLRADRDIDEFERLTSAGRQAADAMTARDRFAEALALWRGPVLADVADTDFAAPSAARWEEARVAATEAWYAARSSLEPAAAIVADLEEFAAAHPLREQPHALLIAALAATGRQADAVGVYEHLRTRLADELGLDPSPELAGVYTAMLRGERVGNLRPSLTSFVGRDRDLARLTRLIGSNRLVTLVGPGGAGKTRLAIEAARTLSGDFTGGVWLVELAPVRDPGDIARALADALQLREIHFLDLNAAQHALDRVLSALAGKELLLVIDNCEHVIDASARMAEALLGASPSVRIVTTSREPLAITGEALCPVGPLATPVENGDARDAASVRLFADRAAAVKPGFAISGTNLAAVTEICRRLDGMPLAIELACARLRTLPVEQVAARLDDRFRLLTGGSRTALPRHRTLSAVVDWSWDLLSEPERLLAEQFSVFLDGATIEAVAEITASANTTINTDIGTIDALAGLVDKSFVTLDDHGRYRMLETIRTYAGDRLADSGRAGPARDAHAAYFADTAARADSHMRDREQAHWMTWFAQERDNLRAALRWAIDSRDAVTAVRLAGSVGWFLLMCDYHDESRSGLGQALAIPGDVPADVRALALAHYGTTLMVHGEQEPAERVLAEARSLGSDHPMVALSAVMARMMGDDPESARQYVPEIIDHPDPWVRAMARTLRGLIGLFLGDADGAESDIVSALAAFESLGDLWARSALGVALGEIRGLRGDRAGAIAMLSESTAAADDLRVPDVAAQARLSLAMQRARSGDITGAWADIEVARRSVSSGLSPQMLMQLRVAAAEVTFRGGDAVGALALYRDVVTAADAVRGLSREIRGGILHGYALAQIAAGDSDAAFVLGVRIMEAARQRPDRMTMAMAAEVFAAVASDRGDDKRVAFLLGAAEAVRGVADEGSPDIAAIVASGRARLGIAAFDRAMAGGRALILADAIEAVTAAADAA